MCVIAGLSVTTGDAGTRLRDAGSGSVGRVVWRQGQADRRKDLTPPQPPRHWCSEA